MIINHIITLKPRNIGPARETLWARGTPRRDRRYHNRYAVGADRAPVDSAPRMSLVTRGYFRSE